MKIVLAIAALIGATYSTYYNSLHGSFLYDDKAIIVGNPLIRDLKNFPLILNTSYWGTSLGAPQAVKGGLYRPITVTSFAVNYAIGKLNPFGYHVVNVLFHALVCVLVGILAWRWGVSRRAAGAAALLFALLPVHTEAVSSIVGRSEVLAAFFALIAWILALDKRPRVALGLGAASFAAALASKENSAALVPLLIFSDVVLFRKPWRELVSARALVWIVFASTLLLYLEWKYLILGSIADAGGIPYFTSPHAWTNLLTMSRFTVERYLKALVFGVGFCADFTRPVFPDAGLSNPLAWIELLALAGLVFLSCWFAFKRNSLLALASVLFFGFLLPESNLLVPLEVIGAERFLYLPSIGFCLALGVLFDRTWSMSKTGSTLALFALSVWYAAATLQRNTVWQSEETFWNATLRDAPKSARAWNGVGSNLMSRKMYDEAIRDFETALSLNPLLVDARYNIALSYFLQDHNAQARKGFEEVLRESPYDTNAMLHLALLDENEHRYKQAARAYAAILEIDPLNRTAKRNLAILHCRAGERKECRAELNAFLSDAPPDEPDNDLRVFLNNVRGD